MEFEPYFDQYLLKWHIGEKKTLKVAYTSLLLCMAGASVLLLRGIVTSEG